MQHQETQEPAKKRPSKKRKRTVTSEDGFALQQFEFEFNEEGNSAKLRKISHYSIAEIGQISDILRDKMRNKSSNYHSFLELSYTGENIFIGIRKGKKLPPGLSLKDCCDNLLKADDTRIPWNDMQPKWLDKKKNAVKIIHSYFLEREVLLN